jgi:hypothetical protein
MDSESVPAVWLLPYLPLSKEVDVGPWMLTPFHTFRTGQARSKVIYREARRLITAYRLPDGLRRFGAIVRPHDGRVGDELAPEPARTLERAIAAALIDSNPGFREEEDPNAAHMFTGPENARLFGYSLQAPGTFAFSEGALVSRVNLVSAPPGRRLPRQPPPRGLLRPALKGHLDAEYATELLKVLDAGSQEARRLERCVQWLVLAWSNSDEIDTDMRILAFRAAFEVLVGGGKTRACGKKLAELLEDQSDKREHQWVEHDKPQTGTLNETEWWFQSFSLLRNAIAHGDELDADNWLFVDDGRPHIWHAADRLREAIKRAAIDAGADPLIGLEPFARLIRRGLSSAQS